MMRLFLEPIDVWLFRDGRPFDAGSDHRAESLFPPFPSVVQGAIRSHELVRRKVDLHDSQAIAKAVGTATDYKDLRIRGPFLARRNVDGKITCYYAAPADARAVQGEEAKPGTALIQPASQPSADPRLRTSAPTPLLLGLGDKPKKGEGGGWLTERALGCYLDGGAVPTECLFTRESRFGIGLDSARRVTREGALYEVEFIRPCPCVGLYVEVEGYPRWPPSGEMRLGGEGRGARFEQVQEAQAPVWPPLPDPLPERFKVYCATPTYFRGGWQPEDRDWRGFFDGPVELAAAAVGRYQSVGGYDLAGGKHKAARRYVPAGSVYYFRCRGRARLQPGLIQNAITDEGGQIGFGQVMICEWKEKER